MNPPDPVHDFLQAVWEQCDPIKATSGRYYKPEFGLPPKKLHVCEAREVNWERAHCLPPYVHAWEFDGVKLVGIDVEGLPDVSHRNGMYWEIGRVEFAIDPVNKQAVYGYWLGPRYGRGYKKSFESLSSLTFSTTEFPVWVS